MSNQTTGGSVKRLLRVGLGTLATLALMATPALAGSDHGNNRGDVWLKNVGQPAGPGHSHDPHLDCVDINLWADKMAESGDAYTIDSWPPSGGGEQVYSDTWTYDRAAGGVQVASVIDVETLIRNAIRAGATAHPIQGYHFKLQFTQNPQ